MKSSVLTDSRTIHVPAFSRLQHVISTIMFQFIYEIYLIPVCNNSGSTSLTLNVAWSKCKLGQVKVEFVLYILPFHSCTQKGHHII